VAVWRDELEEKIDIDRHGKARGIFLETIYGCVCVAENARRRSRAERGNRLRLISPTLKRRKVPRIERRGEKTSILSKQLRIIGEGLQIGWRSLAARYDSPVYLLLVGIIDEVHKRHQIATQTPTHFQFTNHA
jgi:hypothetical protein